MSPRATFKSGLGVGNQYGRFRTFANVLLKSLLRCGCGAVTLIGPSISAFSILKIIICTTSSIWIHGTHCSPLPIFPPAKNFIGNDISSKAPLFLHKMTQKRVYTIRSAERSDETYRIYVYDKDTSS